MTVVHGRSPRARASAESEGASVARLWPRASASASRGARRSASSMPTRSPGSRPQPPDAVLFAETDAGGLRGGEALRRGPRAGHPVRHRHLARRPPQRAVRRLSLDLSRMNRILAVHEADLRLRGRAGRDPQAAQRSSARLRPVLPRRSRRRREPRRHGGDARLRHQRRALRHDARRRAGPHRGACRRQRRQDRRAARGNRRRLRSHPPPGRLGRHARHHHRAHAQALRHSRDDPRPASVPSPRSRAPATPPSPRCRWDCRSPASSSPTRCRSAPAMPIRISRCPSSRRCSSNSTARSRDTREQVESLRRDRARRRGRGVAMGRAPGGPQQALAGAPRRLLGGAGAASPAPRS